MAKNQQQSRLFALDDNNNNDNDVKRKYILKNLHVVVPAAAPPFIMPPPSTGAFFVAPIPLAELVYGGWMPRPHDCCYLVGNYYCATYAGYLHRKYAGVRVLGKPLHDSTCPVRRQFHLR
jgi:hypothetical protein